MYRVVQYSLCPASPGGDIYNTMTKPGNGHGYDPQTTELIQISPILQALVCPCVSMQFYHACSFMQ